MAQFLKRMIGSFAAIFMVGSLGILHAGEVVIQITPSTIIKKGNEEIAIGNSAEALIIFKKALSVNLTDRERADAYNGLCISHRMEGDLSVALENCKKAIRIRPTNWRYYNNLANIHFDRGAYEEAITFYEKARTISPDAFAPIFNKRLAMARVDLLSKGGNVDDLEGRVRL